MRDRLFWEAEISVVARRARKIYEEECGRCSEGKGEGKVRYMSRFGTKINKRRKREQAQTKTRSANGRQSKESDQSQSTIRCIDEAFKTRSEQAAAKTETMTIAWGQRKESMDPPSRC